MYRYLYRNLNVYTVLPPIGTKIDDFQNYNYEIWSVLTSIREMEKTAPPAFLPPPTPKSPPIPKPPKNPSKIILEKLEIVPKLEDMLDLDSDPELQFLRGAVSNSSISSEEEEAYKGTYEPEPDYRRSLPEWCKAGAEIEIRAKENEFDHYQDFIISCCSGAEDDQEEFTGSYNRGTHKSCRASSIQKYTRNT